MINVLLILFLFCIISCIDLIELGKYDKISVKSNSRVYLDISSFNISQSISLDFTMNLFFAKNKNISYTLQIEQVPAKSKDDYIYWNNLSSVEIENKKSNLYPSDYTYSWSQLKKEGMNYIYMILPEPYERFDFYQFKITIENTGGTPDEKKTEEKTEEDYTILLYILIPIILLSISIPLIYYCKRNLCGDYSDDFPEPPNNEKSSILISPSDRLILDYLDESKDKPSPRSRVKRRKNF